MQTFLVLLAFSIAAGFLLKKFVWNPIFETSRRSGGTLDGGKTKCGNDDCACH